MKTNQLKVASIVLFIENQEKKRKHSYIDQLKSKPFAE